MRQYFADTLLEKMKQDDRIVLVTADLGYKIFDQIREQRPKQFLNVGAAEQCMLGVGVGLALEGKIPFCYSITPFLLYRAAETIRNYINREKIPVMLIGSGRGSDYEHDGFSHWAGDDKDILDLFKHIGQFYPVIPENVPKMVDFMIENKKPYYLNLKR